MHIYLFLIFFLKHIYFLMLLPMMACATATKASQDTFFLYLFVCTLFAGQEALISVLRPGAGPS
jgi:hypothetical protein